MIEYKIMADIEQQKSLPKSEEKKPQESNKKETPEDTKEALDAARNALQGLHADIPVEQITDEKVLKDVLSMKIRDYPKSVPAYLDMIVEKNPKLLDSPAVSALIAQKVQELLHIVSQKPELSRDREWMDTLRKTLNRLVIKPDIAVQISQFGTMDTAMRQELQKDLGISEKITEWLDQNTRDIIQRVHTGFYRFDPEVNTWVNSVWALVFLWPENIAGIKKYLTVMQPDHPFLSVTNYRSHDKAWKYAVVSDGRPHNMMLAESDYLTTYLQKRSEWKSDKQVFEELGRHHVAHLKNNAEVTKAIKNFEKKYGEGSFSVAKESQLHEENRIISRSIISHGEYEEMREVVGAEKYELLLEERPEMRDIITDVIGGFIRFNRHTHTFQTVTNVELRFTDSELQMMNDIFEKTHPDYMFLKDKKIPTYPRDKRKKNQYNEKILKERILFYQQ